MDVSATVVVDSYVAQGVNVIDKGGAHVHGAVNVYDQVNVNVNVCVNQSSWLWRGT